MVKIGLFKKKPEQRALDDLLLEAVLGTDEITVTKALAIPAVSACVELISTTIASLPIKLYSEKDGKVTEIAGDNRVKLLNDDTKDIYDGYQFKKLLVRDYLLKGTGFAYIKRVRNEVESLHYVNYDQVSIYSNCEPIFKRYDIYVQGARYRDFEFLKITRNIKDSMNGIGVVKENNKMLSVIYNALLYEEILAKTGGNKKGFLMSEKKLDEGALTTLKTAWNNLYKNNTENMIVLNNGLTFKEASATPVETQMNENKITNTNGVYSLFATPVSLFDGTATPEVHNNFVKIAILPIVKAIQTALNKDLLLELEKGSFYFAADLKELLKGDLLSRYQAYGEAVKAGWIGKNEIRYIEDLAPIEGLDVVTMSLGEVIFDMKTQKYFIPNTDSVMNQGMKKSVEVIPTP